MSIDKLLMQLRQRLREKQEAAFTPPHQDMVSYARAAGAHQELTEIIDLVLKNTKGIEYDDQV